MVKELLSVQEKISRPIQIQERDKDLIRWINGFGWTSVPFVCGLWGCNRQAASKRLALLHDNGLLQRERKFREYGYQYWPTKEALKLIGDDLPPIKKINLGTFEHDWRVMGLAVRLMNEGGKFEAERRIRSSRNEGQHIGLKGHVPDGHYWAPEAEHPVAIEVEISLKNRKRLERIIDDYKSSFDYEGIRYFTDNNDVAKVLRRYIDNSYITLEVVENGCW